MDKSQKIAKTLLLQFIATLPESLEDIAKEVVVYQKENPNIENAYVEIVEIGENPIFAIFDSESKTDNNHIVLVVDLEDEMFEIQDNNEKIQAVISWLRNDALWLSREISRNIER